MGAVEAGAVSGRPGERPLKIVVHDFAGHPFAAQLSRALAHRRHDVVHAFCGNVVTGRGRVQRDAGDPPSLEFVPVVVSDEFARYSLWRRPLQELRYGTRLVRLVSRHRPDVVISANTPLLAQAVLRRHAQRSGVTFVYWLQDLLGIGTAAQLRRRLGPLGGALGERLRSLESHVLRRSDAVVAISSDFVPLLTAMGVDVDRITPVENWAPLEELPALPRDNEWAVAHGLAGVPVYLYAGTLGLKHDPELLLGLAEALTGDAEIVVVSEGLGAEWLREQAPRRGAGNLQVLPYQPYERLGDVVAAADVLVALLTHDAGVFSVPSKVLTYHCAGRAILAAIPPENLAARLVERNRTGLTVPPGDVDAFVAAARTLLADEDLRRELGRNARHYAEQTFDIATIADRFEAVIDRARGDPARAQP